jgi:hypothetical protein
MKSILNIIVSAVILLTYSAINMYASGSGSVSQAYGTESVGLNAVIPLTIDVYPVGSLNDPPGYLIGQGDTRPMSSLYIEYTVRGGDNMNVSLSNNGNGIETEGNGVSLQTAWMEQVNGNWPAGNAMTTNMLAEDQLSGTGRLFLRCYILSIMASSNATLGLHTIDLTLTAAYRY